MRLKVLQILEATGGGTARHVVDLCHGLVLRGVEVHLAYSPLRMDNILAQALPELEKAGVRCLEVPMRRAPHPSDFIAVFALYRYLRSHGPFTHIHGHSSKAGALARILGLFGGPKVIYTPHAFYTHSLGVGKNLRWIYGIIERALSFSTDALIAVSDYEAKEAFRLGYSRIKTVRIPNGVSLNVESAEEKQQIRRKWNLECDAIVIGFVGRLTSQKSPHVLLEAFSRVTTQHPKALLVMIGDGPLKSWLREKVLELGIENRVVWQGFIDGRWAMRGFDIFALPSEYEGFPYVLLEAMAEGLPIVATCVGGADQAIVDGENGFVVPVGDVMAFAGALDRLLSDEALRLSMGAQSRLRVKEFSVEKMVDATLALYRELAGR